MGACPICNMNLHTHTGVETEIEREKKEKRSIKRCCGKGFKNSGTKKQNLRYFIYNICKQQANEN